MMMAVMVMVMVMVIMMMFDGCVATSTYAAHKLQNLYLFDA